MGGDGGVHAVNRKFFAACRNTSKDGKSDALEEEERVLKKNSQRFIRCHTCSLSGEELTEPIVTCKLGYLFSKERLITALLDKTLHASFGHIKGLKDVKELIFTPNPEYTPVSSSVDYTLACQGSQEVAIARYMCPVTQQPFNGSYPFVAIWKTGYVLSEKALREIGHDGLQMEYGPFTADDVVGLLPNDEELTKRRASLEVKMELAKKKAKEEKKRQRENGEAPAANGKARAKKTSKINNDTVRSEKVKINSKLASSATIAAEAQNHVAASKASNDMYGKLFHKDKDAKKSGRDLFMSVAGIRYTL